MIICYHTINNMLSYHMQSKNTGLEFRQWEFVVDTEDDMFAWIDSFQKVLVSSAKKQEGNGHSAAEDIVIS